MVGATVGWGATSQLGGGRGKGGGGGQQLGCLRPLRTALHAISKYKSPKQFELQQS